MPKHYISPEQYLEIERAAEYRSEYRGGEMSAMPGACESHSLIVGNLIGGLVQQLRATPCYVFTIDMRVQVGDSGPFAYPDVTAVCGEPRFRDEQRDSLLNPMLIVEVLSESTEAYDRGDKFQHYRTLESFTEYLLVSSNHVSAELFTRQPDGRWLLSAANTLESSIELPSVGCRLTLADVYEKVDISLVPFAVMRPVER